MVSGDAMSPTYKAGEYLLINELSKDFKRNDVVVLRYPNNTSSFFIKRIIGLPGESISVKNNAVFVNGQMVREQYYTGQTSGNIAVVLGVDEYFVLGDNRLASTDSRDWGPIKKPLLVGKILADVGNFAIFQR